MDEKISGFVTGFVTSIADPQGLHRVRALIPGVFEPEAPYWIWPGVVPGGGGTNRGALYPPPPVNARIHIMFEHGYWESADAHAIYFPGYYSLDNQGVSEGPTSTYEATTADKARQRVTIWEDETFAIYVVNEATDKRLVLEERHGGAKIEINATAGTTKTGCMVEISGRTGVSINATGLIDLDSRMTVQVMGRRVARLKSGGV